jgi:hypothetical protein
VGSPAWRAGCVTSTAPLLASPAVAIHQSERVVWPTSQQPLFGSGSGGLATGAAIVGGLGASAFVSGRGDAAETPLPNRRRFVAGAVVATGAAWIAPTILTMDARAAAASGCFGHPGFVGYAEASDIGSASATVTNTFTVSGVPTAGSAVDHIAVGIVDHIAGLAASSLATPPGWLLLGFYDSDVATPGLDLTGSLAEWSERVYVWRRTGALSSSYPFSVTYSGSNFQPQARVVVGAYSNAGTILHTPDEFSIQGGGIISPVTPPPSALVTIPAIITDSANTLVIAFAGAGNISNTNTITTPVGYTLDATANSGNGFPPIWLFSKAVGLGGAAATSATVVLGAMNVGGQLTISCG